MVETIDAEVGPEGSYLPHAPSTFRGSGSYLIDDKNRLTLPMPMRRPLLAGGSMAAVDATINLWPERSVRAMTDVLFAEARRADLELVQVKLFLASLVEVKLDSQGRIVVPEALRAEAGIDRSVTVCGVGPHIEIWDAARWDHRLLDRDDTVAEALIKAGF